MRNADDIELAAYVVPIEWKKTFDIEDAKTFAEAFANQNIACKIYQQATADFLTREFDVDE